MDSIRGSEAKALVVGGEEPDSAQTGTVLQTNSSTVRSLYMAGTVYPYSDQDMPIRGVPDRFSYHMFG